MHSLYSSWVPEAKGQVSRKRKRGEDSPIKGASTGSRRRCAREVAHMTDTRAAGVNLKRERIFYGRPTRTARGKIHHGLPSDRELRQRLRC